MTEVVKLDRFDELLLDRVRRNNLEPARAMAAAVGLSESAVLRRLRRLRQERVIVGDIAVVDPARLSPGISIHVLVELERHGQKAEQVFAAKIIERPEVVGAWNVAGRTDFVVMVNVPSLEAYQAFADTVFGEDPNVAAFETLICLREVLRFDPLRVGQVAPVARG